MQIEVVLDFPRTMYKVPGPKNGAGFLPGLTYDDLIVESEDAAKGALKAGFFLTPNEAAEAYKSKPKAGA